MMKNEKPSIEPLLAAAEEKLLTNDVSRALFCYNSATEWEIPDLRLWKGMASCYYILGDFDLAAHYWSKALELDPYDIEVQQRLVIYRSPSFQSWLKRISEAVKTVEMKDYERARDQLKELLEENDGVVSLYQILGLSHMACSDQTSARRIWARGLELDTSNPMLLKYLKSLDKIHKIGQHGGKKMMRQPVRRPWIKVGTGAAALLTCLAIFTAIQQNSPSQNKKLTNMLEDTSAQETSLVSGNDREIVLSRAGSTIALRETAATDAVESCLAEKEELQQYNRGFMAYLQNDWDMADKSFSAVIQRASGTYINREALYYLARIQYLSKQYSQAESNFQQYLKQFPESNYYDESLYYLACIYHRTGRDDKAENTFRELYRLVPESGYLTSADYREVNVARNQ